MKIKVNLPTGKIEENFDSDRVMVGRSNRCDFTISDESLSRYHCLIEYKDGNFLLTDVGSSNGVYINGEKLQAHVQYIYNSFNTLSIGKFDFFIEEDEKEIPSVPVPSSAEIPQKKINPQKTAPKFNSDNPIVKNAILPLIILIAVGAYYFMQPEENLETNTLNSRPAITKSRRNQVHHTIPNVFYSADLYVSQDKKRNCDGENEIFCQNMKLDYSAEGFFKADNELSVYIKPSLYFSESRYRGIKTSDDVSELVALDKFLTSVVMDKYFINGNFQVHLILKNKNNKLFKVFRFHPGKYLSNLANRMDALNLLENAIIGVSTSENFWKHLHAYIPEMTIEGENYE